MKRIIVFEHITLSANRFLGTSHALVIGMIVIALWGISFLFNKSTWHSAIVEITAIVSFVNIFIVQRAQNKDLKAIHLKLDELIASSSASNLLIKAEDAPERVLEQVEDIYKTIAKTTGEELAKTNEVSSTIEHIMETVHNDITHPKLTPE